MARSRTGLRNSKGEFNHADLKRHKLAKLTLQKTGQRIFVVASLCWQHQLPARIPKSLVELGNLFFAQFQPFDETLDEILAWWPFLTALQCGQIARLISESVSKLLLTQAASGTQ